MTTLLEKINDIEVTHTYRGIDCIILTNQGELRKVKFTDGRIEVIHRTRLLPIRKNRPSPRNRH